MNQKTKTTGKTEADGKTSKGIYQVTIEGNDIDASSDIEQVLNKYLTNYQNKVEVEFLRVDEEENWTENPEVEFECQKCGLTWKQKDGETCPHCEEETE